MEEIDKNLDMPINDATALDNGQSEHNAPFFDEYGNRLSTSGKILLSLPENASGHITIPEGIEHVTADAFKRCGLITEITIPTSLKTLHHSNFRKQNSLLRFHVSPDNVFLHTDAGGKALFNQDYTFLFKVACDVEEIQFPFGITAIGNHAFQGCAKLRTIAIPDTVNMLGASAFADCTSLSDITIGTGVKKLPGWLFKHCTSLQHIAMPDSLRRIGTGTFAQCTSLAQITLPSDLQAINDEAFIDCSNLRHIFIPRWVKAVGTAAFEGCSSLSAIDVDDDNAKLSSEGGLLYNKYQSQLLRCPENASFEALPELLSSFADAAFSGCKKITKIAIPQYITSLPKYCFAFCENLETVELNQNLTHIGQSAFEGCKRLENITLPQSVKTIGDYAFAYCASIEELTLPENLTDIGSDESKENMRSGCTFYGCKSLKHIEIPNRIANLGEYCFGNCESLETVSLPYMIDYIYSDLFAGCHALKELVLANPYTKFDDGALPDNTSVVYK
mgnify:CR=1 FL=1